MKLGNIHIDKPLLLAPMENITDLPFRHICKKLGADIVYTEFTSSDAIIRRITKTLAKMNFTEDERPLGIQIFGSDEETMCRAVTVVEQWKPDIIDINAGCWARKHVGHGQGAALLKDLNLFEKIVKKVVLSTSIPVTVKTRLGWDQKNIIILEVARMLEQAGVQALTVHCRTRNQAYKGKADWSWLARLKKIVSIPIIANGDVTDPSHVKKLFDMGCDGVMIGRQALTNPWIFRDTKYFLESGEYPAEPSLREKIDLCVYHLKLSVRYKGLRDGLIPFRKYYQGYLNGLPHIAKLRSDLMKMVDLNEIINRLYHFADNQTPLRSF